MAQRHLKPLNKIFGYIFLMTFFWSCNKIDESKLQENKNFKQVIIKDSAFKKGLDHFISETNKYQIEPSDSIIVMLYINQDSDTIMSFVRFRPYLSVNLLGANRYKKYDLYFYASQNLKPVMNRFVDVNNGKVSHVLLQPIDESMIDPTHSYYFDVKNNKIELPFE